MPQFTFSQALVANQLGFNPLTSWQFERIPVVWGQGYVNILVRATTTGTRITIYSGTTTIVQRSPIQGGGTAGVTPSPLNTTPIDYLADGDDRQLIQIDEVAAGTPTVDGVINIEPA